MRLFILLVIVLLMATMMGGHDNFCMCPQCEATYDQQWEADHAEDLK